ncbi:hypothetical protein L1987_43701 [Smallanthus sonchifolius]|uniref:Uncharacterized protein n=1 Tax=Smallanthus sonchifolius TaxID=185202 RepID=A0ACB9GLT7_9ASTR|nr:hypothetical protein L1987_43701 [Smallanthus sonchifolius]
MLPTESPHDSAASSPFISTGATTVACYCCLVRIAIDSADLSSTVNLVEPQVVLCFVLEVAFLGVDFSRQKTNNSGGLYYSTTAIEGSCGPTRVKTVSRGGDGCLGFISATADCRSTSFRLSAVQAIFYTMVFTSAIEDGTKSKDHLISAAAFVEGGTQDACDDACST